MSQAALVLQDLFADGWCCKSWAAGVDCASMGCSEAIHILFCPVSESTVTNLWQMEVTGHSAQDGDTQLPLWPALQHLHLPAAQSGTAG